MSNNNVEIHSGNGHINNISLRLHSRLYQPIFFILLQYPPTIHICAGLSVYIKKISDNVASLVKAEDKLVYMKNAWDPADSQGAHFRS